MNEIMSIARTISLFMGGILFTIGITLILEYKKGEGGYLVIVGLWLLGANLFMFA